MQDYNSKYSGDALDAQLDKVDELSVELDTTKKELTQEVATAKSELQQIVGDYKAEADDKLAELESDITGDEIILKGEIRPGNISITGGIVETDVFFYKLYNITELKDEVITVVSSENNQYTSLWSLFPNANLGYSDVIAHGELTNNMKTDTIDLSLYPQANYLCVAVGSAGKDAVVSYRENGINPRLLKVEKEVSNVRIAVEDEVGRIYREVDAKSWVRALYGVVIPKGSLLFNRGVSIALGEDYNGAIIGQKNILSGAVAQLDKDYKYITAREDGDIVFTLGAEIKRDIYELQLKNRFYKSTSQIGEAYEKSLLDIYLDKEVYEAHMWCYNNALYLRYKKTENSEAVYAVNSLKINNVENYAPITFSDEYLNGYVVFRDISLFISNPTGEAIPLSVSAITASDTHSYLWIYNELKSLYDTTITTEKIANGAITIKKTNFVEVRQGNQLYDNSTMGDAGKWYYWKGTQGVGATVTLQQNQYTSSYTAIKMPISGQKQITLSQRDETDAYIYSYFVVDSQMNAISYQLGSNLALSSGVTIDIPDSAEYLLLSVVRINDDLFMANEGADVLPFEEYRQDTYVNGINISKPAEKEEEDNIIDNVEISLPDTICAVVGDTLQLFYRGIVKAVNPYNYNIVVSCDKGNQYPRYFEYTPISGDVGRVPFKITVKNNNRVVIAEKSCTIKVVDVPSSPSSKKRIAIFGDSLTAGGTWVGEAYRRLTATNGTPTGVGLTNIDFVGPKTNNGAGYFGVGGWQWTSYTTKGSSAYRFQVNNVSSLSVGAVYTNNGNTFTIMEVNVTDGAGNILCSVSSLTPAPTSSGTLTKSSGSGDATISFTSYAQNSLNPLWDYEQNKMTFIPYANKYAEGKIDIVYTLLSWNGVSAGMTDFSQIVGYAKKFADTLHAEFPNAKLKIMGIQVPSVNGGMGANYGATGRGYADGYGMVVTALNMNKAYQDFANESGYADFVEFVNVSSQFDTENNMPQASTMVNTRSSLTEKRGTNGVHPSNEGYMQIADVVYRNIVANL